ncbi:MULTISPECIES: hypothetical protein [unclassified Herbaspirillum]|jgi:hypothetical protein|uniref:hypothetical protein n=1 Tax=unclassified Herbaspirillum TaxID=2624150 RepID=UPI001314CC44|nr:MULTISPECIES: hypothetical protein [unclassified Herbaspirillum]
MGSHENDYIVPVECYGAMTMMQRKEGKLIVASAAMAQIRFALMAMRVNSRS